MNELTSALLDQAARDGLIVVAQERDNSGSDDWREIDYVPPMPADIAAENAIYGWAKYRVIARKHNDDELAAAASASFTE